MTKIWAIAVIAVHNAFRSRVVAVLLGVLLLTIVGMPLTLQGDGTASGYARIVLHYTLGFAGLILAVATVWAGCAAVASEIQGRQLHMVTTKPVHRIQIWLGKWLGLLMVNGGLLIISGAVIYGLLSWNLRPGTLSDQDQAILREQVLVTRQPVRALSPPGLDEEARKAAERRVAQGDLDPSIPFEQVLHAIRNERLLKAYRVPHESNRQWSYPIPPDHTPGKSLLLRYRFTASQVGPIPVTGQWSVTRTGADDPLYQAVTTNVAHRTYTLSIDDTHVKAGDTLHIQYRNINPSPVTVVFQFKDEMRLMVYEGPFVMNLVRALLLIFFQLALLGAIGLTAGTLFSMPVAALVSGYAIILLQAGPYIQRVADSSSVLTFASPDTTSYMEVPLRIFFNAMKILITPLQGPNPMEMLADGQLLPWGLVGATFLVKMILYSGSLAVLGSAIFSKREIALASP